MNQQKKPSGKPVKRKREENDRAQITKKSAKKSRLEATAAKDYQKPSSDRKATKKTLSSKNPMKKKQMKTESESKPPSKKFSKSESHTNSELKKRQGKKSKPRNRQSKDGDIISKKTDPVSKKRSLPENSNTTKKIKKKKLSKSAVPNNRIGSKPKLPSAGDSTTIQANKDGGKDLKVIKKKKKRNRKGSKPKLPSTSDSATIQAKQGGKNEMAINKNKKKRKRPAKNNKYKGLTNPSRSLADQLLMEKKKEAKMNLSANTADKQVTHQNNNEAENASRPKQVTKKIKLSSEKQAAAAKKKKEKNKVKNEKSHNLKQEMKGEEANDVTIKKQLKVKQQAKIKEIKKPKQRKQLDTKTSSNKSEKNVSSTIKNKDKKLQKIEKKIPKEKGGATPSAAAAAAATLSIEEDSSSRGQPYVGNSSGFREMLLRKLGAGQFRFINEKLYKLPSAKAFKMFLYDNNSFMVYHKGFTNQVAHWPVNPVDKLISYIKNKPSSLVIADMGCGDAKIARSVKNKVHSFDLAALNQHVTVCDMTKVPLAEESIDIVVFCLSLMNTNIEDFLNEANRILKTKGILKIAEVESRFNNFRKFVRSVEKLGFELVSKDKSNKYFVTFEFKKVSATPKRFNDLPGLILKPCLYKKR